MDINSLKSRFLDIYGPGEAAAFFSPSRINLIGEHIDYNGGMVLPCAISLGTYGIARRRSDNMLCLASENMDIRADVSLEGLKYEKKHGWANYAKGVVFHLMKAGYKAGGMEILVSGNIPSGAGLSSSASLEMLVGEMANQLYNNGEIDRIELIKLCQKAENSFVGVMCGIMDQFAIGMGRKNKSIFLNCETLQYEYVDLDLKDYTIVIMNTNKRRALNESKYNERRSQCDKALEILRQHREIENLCQLSPDDFQLLSPFIEDETIRKRAQHAVYENDRVKKATLALKNEDIELLGRLIKESHDSLKNLYEVTGRELDAIADAANSMDFCAGARMTGAGFGGCAIAIVRNERVNEFIDNVNNLYKEKIGYDAGFFVTGIGDGTKMLQNTGE